MDAKKWVDTTVEGRSTSEAVAEDARRARIVVAAVEAIDDVGPHVGMAQIADRSGLARPNVYRHFASKEQLDAEVTRFAATELIRRVRPSFSRVGTQYDVVRGVIAPCVAWASEHPNLYRFIAAQRQTKALHRARMGRTRFLNELVEATRAYLRSTQVVEEPPEGWLAGMMGMVDASIIWWLDHRDETQDQVVNRLTRQVTVVVREMLAEIGLNAPDDMVLKPQPH